MVTLSGFDLQLKRGLLVQHEYEYIGNIGLEGSWTFLLCDYEFNYGIVYSLTEEYGLS